MALSLPLSPTSRETKSTRPAAPCSFYLIVASTANENGGDLTSTSRSCGG